MSSCRCGDISTCQARIKKLKENLESVRAWDENFSGMEENLDQLVSYNSNAFVNPEMSVLNNNLKEINDDMIEFTNDLKEKMQNKIDDLNAKLTALKAEDDDYHENEE